MEDYYIFTVLHKPVRIILLFLWISVNCVSFGDGYNGYDQSEYFGECNKFLYSETLEPPPNRLVELHIRHNFQGSVEIRDGMYNSKTIRIEIEKTGPSELEIEGIQTNQTLYDVGRGNIYVVQLDHVKRHSRTVTIVLGAAIAGAIFLALTSLLIWWYYHKRNQHFSPIHAQGLTAAAGHGDGKDSTYEEELVESSTGTLSTPVHRVNGGTQGTQSCPPPPPPCRGDPTYMSTAEVQSQMSPATSQRSGGSGGGVGSPRGMSKATVMSLTVVMVISVVYAACPYDAQARVIIIIPPLVKLEYIKVFFNKNYQNEVYSEGWEQKNGTQIHIFDLDDARPTFNPPCHGDCPAAYVQNLAGCDAATGRCVCQKGFTLDGGACIDIDECYSELHSCPATASCQNTIGTYTCQCGYGFYGDRRTCKHCTVGCPAGHYEFSPCTKFGDRVCKECTKCTGAQYEARPCGEYSNRECMHVAHPLLIAGDETTPVFLEGLKVEVSDNVFLEDLHNIRNLETIYYVTDTTQAYDFYWVRDSGLQVNIGVAEIHLIPEYEDEDHVSDNEYMLSPKNPNNSEDKAKFMNIIEKHCRNPIPEYYSITLEIYRDRTTTAAEIICNSKNPNLPPCPDGYVDGDTYLYRTLNDACPKMGTFPEDLVHQPNCIVCTDNTDFLRAIFNQTYTTERPISFPPRRCKTAEARCDQCLAQSKCRALDNEFDQKCCQIDCYTLPDCKMAQSEECTSAKVECAMGDAYRYTIQPVFQNIRQYYKCHIKRKEPKVLYQIFFYVEIPEKNFQTPKVYKTIYAQDLAYQSSGEYNADYINVEHSTGLNLHEEFILIGQEGPDNHFNHSVYYLKEPDDFRKKKVVIHEISPNVYVASTQFERPFDYSTASWDNGQCNKNVSKFQKVQRHYGTEGQPVYVVPQASKTEPYTYYLKSTDPDPFIRFKVPGNMSILPYYFRDDGPELLTDETLKASLELTSSQRIWEIHISGRMTNCPAYLGVTINNRIRLEEIFRYDLLVLCQAEIPEPVFNLTFKVPNWGQEPDKTFDIHLEDSKQSYDIYLTQMLFEQQRLDSEPAAIKMPSAPKLSKTLFAVVGGVTLAILFIMLIAFVYTEHTKAKVVFDNSGKARSGGGAYADTGAHCRADDETTPTCGAGTVLDQKQTVFIGIYIFLRIVYSLLFTFTVFFAVLMLFIDADLKQLSKLDSYQGEKYNSTLKLREQIDDYSQGELLRQGELITSMQGACSHYIGELFDAMAKEMDNITANQHQLDMYGQDSSISYLMHSRAQRVMEGYSERLQNFTDTYQENVRRSIKPALARYQRYLQGIYKDEWYKFPQMLFNKSTAPMLRPRYVRNNEEFHGPEVDFSVFLEIEEVENIQLWDIQFWENYLNSLPELPRLPVPKVDHQAPECQLDTSTTTTSGLSNHTALDHLSSSQFISTHIITEENLSKGPKYTSGHYAEEFKFMAPEKGDGSQDMVFSIDEFITSINIDMLRIVFLVLDAILLLYRFSHTYMNSTMLCHGFEDSVQQKTDSNKQPSAPTTSTNVVAMGTPVSPSSNQTYSTLTSRTSSHHYPEEGHYVETTLPDYSAPLNGQRSTSYLQPVTHQIDPPYAEPRSYQQSPTKPAPAVMTQHTPKDHNFEVLKQSVVQLILSTTLPKVLVAVALLVLFYLVIQAANLYLDVVVISQLEGFSVFLGALDIQLNQTNWYLMDQADHFNEVTMKIYESQMTSELLNLKSMVDYFNSEQHRLVENYVTEACAITKQHQLNWTCGVDITAPKLHVPMLPCNFVPIQPELYTAFNSQNYESQLGQSFEPYVSAGRNIILKSAYAICVVMAAMLVVHVTGAVLFHFLKTRHKFPVRKVYISSSPPSGGGACGIPNPLGGQGDESEYDTDDIDGAGGGAYATYATPTRVRMSPQKSNTLQTDFKYSETKV